MSAGTPPVLYVIAGPNGSGKSTLSLVLHSRHALPVIDPDAIARTLRPDALERAAVAAAREALRLQQEFLTLRTSFILETTLAGTGVLRLMRQARDCGFSVRLVFVCLDTVEGNIVSASLAAGTMSQRMTYVAATGAAWPICRQHSHSPRTPYCLTTLPSRADGGLLPASRGGRQACAGSSGMGRCSTARTVAGEVTYCRDAERGSSMLCAGYSFLPLKILLCRTVRSIKGPK